MDGVFWNIEYRTAVTEQEQVVLWHTQQRMAGHRYCFYPTDRMQVIPVWTGVSILPITEMLVPFLDFSDGVLKLVPILTFFDYTVEDHWDMLCLQKIYDIAPCTATRHQGGLVQTPEAQKPCGDQFRANTICLEFHDSDLILQVHEYKGTYPTPPLTEPSMPAIHQGIHGVIQGGYARQIPRPDCVQIVDSVARYTYYPNGRVVVDGVLRENRWDSPHKSFVGSWSDYRQWGGVSKTWQNSVKRQIQCLESKARLTEFEKAVRNSLVRSSWITEG